jgi:hypothetical protein
MPLLLKRAASRHSPELSEDDVGDVGDGSGFEMDAANARPAPDPLFAEPIEQLAGRHEHLLPVVGSGDLPNIITVLLGP